MYCDYTRVEKLSWVNEAANKDKNAPSKLISPYCGWRGTLRPVHDMSVVLNSVILDSSTAEITIFFLPQKKWAVRINVLLNVQ